MKIPGKPRVRRAQLGTFSINGAPQVVSYQDGQLLFRKPGSHRRKARRLSILDAYDAALGQLTMKLPAASNTTV